MSKTPTHRFRSVDAFARKQHAHALSIHEVGALGAQVRQREDDLWDVVILCHRPEPVARWLQRQTPDRDWILERLDELESD